MKDIRNCGSSCSPGRRIYYTAHEVLFAGKVYSPESDMWSLGCIFYALLTGVNPFETQNLEASIINIYNVKFVKELDDVRFFNIIKRLLDRQPALRMKIDELYYALIDLLKRLSSPSPFPSP